MVVAEEVDLSQDLQQWEALSKSENHFISHVALGYDKKYNVENPFDWMKFISLQAKPTSLREELMTIRRLL
ncbi:hypothetical protein HAX54_029161 [Datura stramonium]|uniref:Uncharacterized protein n=1 Tax=Datura stramonium TaxID=4076 RepID=A0ABS8SA41_DATST|nr:hypothetical protein [Datura stramonium]